MFMRLREERGIAIVTAVLVSMVVLSLAVTVTALSQHNVGQSAFDRKRIQAIDAAEAGINAYFSMVQGATGPATCSPLDADLPTTPPAQYHVEITLYSIWPPGDGYELDCPPPTDPLGAVIVSEGTAVTADSPIAVTRTMQTQVRMDPIYGGLNKAIFSDTALEFQNKLNVNGYEANDGDVYTNGNLELSNNTVISGTAYAQGWADIAQGIVKQNVWANDYVQLSNQIEVFGNVTSSTSSISLSNNSHVYGDAKAGTTIAGGQIDGSQTPNSSSEPPPQIELPEFPWDEKVEAEWVKAGYDIQNYTSCAAAKSFIDTMPAGDYVVRVSPVCALSWGNNSTINVRGNLAIFTDGSISTVNQTNWNSVGGEWTVFFIVPYREGLNCTKPSPYDISVSNNTGFNNGLKTFVYAQCNVDFGNNNAEGVNGQIIGGTVTITNQMTLNYFPILVPGFNLTGYNVEVAFLREITNR